MYEMLDTRRLILGRLQFVPRTSKIAGDLFTLGDIGLYSNLVLGQGACK